MRAFGLPADDADVEVIELGENPCVATRDRAHLYCKPPPIRGSIDEREWHVRFERDEVPTRTADAELSGDRSVHPVGADNGSGARRPGLRSDGRSARVQRYLPDRCSVAEGRARL